ncbi:MAG: hypothetical protein LBP36_04405 [Oscillospiraceae bacterium]|nr:hypothetical protein [Oscillospiraceae bacterium]
MGGGFVLFYKELAGQYAEEADVLKAHIKKLKKELAPELARGNLSVRNRVATLYGMYLDLRTVGSVLWRRSEEFDVQ